MSTAPWEGFLPLATEVKAVAKDIKKRREKAEEKRYDVECWVIEYLRSNDLQGWLDGTARLVIPSEAVSAVEAAICDEFAGDPRRWAINFLVRGLERGRKELDWSVRPPSRIVKLRLPSPALNPERFGELQVADVLRADFLERWHTRGPSRLAVRSGDIVFAAIAFSGLIHAPRVIDFCKHAHMHLNRHDDTCWVEWPSSPSRWDRLLLDPITEALLLRWRIEQGLAPLLQGPVTTTSIWQTVNDVLHLRRRSLRSLRALLAPFQSAWAFELPPVIHRWATGQQASAVLPPASFFRVLSRQRLLDGPRPETSEGAVRGRAKGDENAAQSALPPALAPVSGQQWIQRLRAIVPRKKKPAPRTSGVIQALEVFITGVPAGALPALLAQWIKRDIQSRRSGGRKLRISSAFTLLSRIDRRLSLFLADQSPLLLTDSWEDLLLQIAASVRPSNRGPVVSALRAFHRYLQDAHGFPALDVDLGDGAESSVDANLVSEEEFFLIRQVLRRHDRTHPEVRTEIAAILARRGCLRRSEAHGLRIRDVIGHDRLIMLVVPHKKRRLKRGASRRLIDLTALCTEEESTLIRDFVTRKRTGTSGMGDPLQDSPLFDDPENPGWPVSERRLFEPIEAAMRAVTGDPRLRFHHLRHSGVNLYGLKIFEDLLPGTARLLENPAATPTQSLAPALLDALVGQTHPVQPRLWSVAAVAGHATPETTLESYFHLCDWVLYRLVLRCTPPLDDTLIAALAGMTVSHLRVLRHRHGREKTQLSALLWARMPPEVSVLPAPGLFELLSLPEPAAEPAGEDVDTSRVIPCQLLSALHQEEAPSNAAAVCSTLKEQMRRVAAAPKRFSNDVRTTTLIGRARITRAWSLPGIPPAKAERLQCDSLGLALAQLGKRYPRLMAKWLSLYAQNRFPRAHSVRLLQPTQAQWWLERFHPDRPYPQWRM